MLWFVLGLLYLLAGVLFLYREVRYISSVHALKLISYARLIYALTHGFAGCGLCWLYFFRGTELRLENLVVMDYDADALLSLYIYWFFTCVGYISMSSAYAWWNERGVQLRLGDKKLRRVRDLSENQVIFLGLCCFAVGAFSLHMWTADLGGVLKFIPLASGIRGDYTNVYGNTHRAWRQPAKITLAASYLFYFLLLKDETKHKFLSLLMTAASMSAAVLFLICNDGRLTTALYFVVLVIGLFTHKKVKIADSRKLLVRLAVLAVLAGILLGKLDDITYFIRHRELRPAGPASGDPGGLVRSLMEEFLFIYKSGIVSIRHILMEGGALQLKADLALGCTAWLPSSLKPFVSDYTLVSRLNTALCTGSSGRTVGSVPCSMIALSVYDLGLIGPVLIPALIGFAMSLTEGHFKGRKRDPYHLTVYFGLALAFFRVVNYCEMTDFMQGIFPYFCVYCIAHVILLLSGAKTGRSVDAERF